MKVQKVFLWLLIFLGGFVLIFIGCGSEKGQEPKKATSPPAQTEKQPTPVTVEQTEPEPMEKEVEPVKVAEAPEPEAPEPEALKPKPPEPEAKEAKIAKRSGWFTASSHVVKKGENLWWIAQYREVYNDPWQWPRIYEANREQIEDPDLIYPGQVFTIPR